MADIVQIILCNRNKPQRIRDFNKNEIAIVTKFKLASLILVFNICIKFIVMDNYFEPVLYI